MRIFQKNIWDKEKYLISFEGQGLLGLVIWGGIVIGFCLLGISVDPLFAWIAIGIVIISVIAAIFYI